MNNIKKKVKNLSTNKLYITEESLQDIKTDTELSKDNNIHRPTGGFPPIFITDKYDKISSQKFQISSEIKDINIANLIKKKKDDADLFI
jgi:hypothetical protein